MPRRNECSIFVDETGGEGGQSRYYAVTLVFHDQADDISGMLSKYEKALRDRGFEDIPFHASPLMNGHDRYSGVDISIRKVMFMAFFVMLQHLPIRYRTFLYRRSEFADNAALMNRLRKDITSFLFDELEYLQSFEAVKIYYDDAQRVVTRSLHAAVEYVLSKESLMYRNASPSQYRLSQAADMICTLELTAQKFGAHEQTRTDEKFFGSAGSFKNNYMKSLKRKRL